MCLRLSKNNIRVKTANEDIICYKVVRNLFSDVKPEYRTYYQYSTIVIGERYNSELIMEKQVTEYVFDEVKSFIYVVEVGLHTFINLEDAKAFAVERMQTRRTRLNVIKCHIPKGSSYYEGLFDPWGMNDGVESYASNSLIYDELVEL